MPDETIGDLIAQWRIHGGWKPSKADFGRLVDEIERLRGENTKLGVRVQEGWARIEAMESALVLLGRAHMPAERHWGYFESDGTLPVDLPPAVQAVLDDLKATVLGQEATDA